MPEVPAVPIVAGIVLAAGQSRRMGTNKLLLQLDGETLIRRACRTGLAAGLDPLIVVVGSQADEIRLALEGLRCQLVQMSSDCAPMSESIHRGLQCLPPSTGAVTIMLADMVRVTESMLRDLSSAAAGSPAPLVVSRYGVDTAPPILFRRVLFPDLLAATGEGCGKAVVQLHRDEALFLDWPVQALIDIDTPQDYASIAQDGTRCQPSSNSRSNSR